MSEPEDGKSDSSDRESYAKAKGGRRRTHISPPPATPARELSAKELAHAKACAAAVHDLIPEAVPFIKDLVSLGMIDGWRNVLSCRSIVEDESNSENKET